MMSAGCCGNGVWNVPLPAMRTKITKDLVLGRALASDSLGQDRHEPIHGGFGKNILFLTIPKTPLPTRRRATQSVRLLGF